MYRYCNSNSFASVVAAVLLALCLCSCGNANITVKTELMDGETVTRVELSDGELFFKSREDVVSELTPQDFEDAKPKASEYHQGELPLEAYSLDGVRYTEEEESMRLLNIYPENWAIPESCGTSPQCLYHVPSFYTLENGEYEYADFYMFNYMYDVNMRPPDLSIRISPAPLKWSQLSSSDYFYPNIVSLRLTYGDINSQIGDMPLAITYKERKNGEFGNSILYSAYFEAGNAAYEILGDGVTQREFIDLLISIYASPRPETRNFFDVIMPNAGD